MLKKGYWYSNQPLLINNSEFKKLNKEPYIIIDGGACGNIVEPFSNIKNSTKFVRFEPRGSESVVFNEDIYVDGGLWDKDTIGILHVGKNQTTSSIYPPNTELLSKFDNRIGLPPRTTEKKIEIKLRSIDSAVKTGEIPKPNFIKLDIHSAEFEAIKGSINSLQENLGFLVETWHSDVHKGQHLHGELESFLLSNGYEVFDISACSRWRHQYDGKISLFDKPRYIGSEILFFRKDIPEHLLLKFIGLCDLFNFSNLAKTKIEESQNPYIKGLLTTYENLTASKKRRWRWIDFGFLTELKIYILNIIR